MPVYPYHFKNGEERWAVVISLPGRKKNWERVYKTRAAAEKAERRAMVKKEKGEPVRSSRQLVSDFLLKVWLPALQDQVPEVLHQTTVLGYREQVYNHLVPSARTPEAKRADRRRGYRGLEGVRLSDLAAHPEILESFYKKLTRVNGQALSPRSVDLIKTTVHKALGAAVRRKLIDHNPADDIEGKRQTNSGRGRQRKKVKHWEPEELRLFLDSVKVRRDWLYEMWSLAAYSGLRRAELAGLRSNLVKLDRGTLEVFETRISSIEYAARVSQPKSQRGYRVVDLDPETIEMLRRWEEKKERAKKALGSDWKGSEYYFCHPDGRDFNPNYLSQRFSALVKGLPVTPISLHGLRHTHITILLSKGVPINVVGERVGDSIRVIEETYWHVLKGQQKEAASAFADAMSTATPNRSENTPVHKKAVEPGALHGG